jgi:hypothetical protein
VKWETVSVVPVFILLGWTVGVGVGFAIGIVALVAFGIPIATMIGALAGTPLGILIPLLSALSGVLPGLFAAIAAALASVPVIVVFLLALVAIFLAYFVVYFVGYLIATAAITPLLPGLTGVPGLAFPIGGPLGTPGNVPVTVPATSGEFFARGLMAGFNASVNFLLIMLLVGFDPFWAPIVASYAFIVISLVTIVFVARNRVYQGFLGWSGLLFPVSYLATFPGLLLFLFNTIASVIARSPGFTVTLDFTTGVVESSDGFIVGLTSFTGGGFSLGNFTFLIGTGPLAAFTVPSTSSHETGHSLNTAAFGGVVLWINAVDENIAPFARFNLAYGELLAEGHSRVMVGTPVPAATPDYSLRLWF